MSTRFIGFLERKHMRTKDLRWFALESIPFMCFFEFKSCINSDASIAYIACLWDYVVVKMEDVALLVVADTEFAAFGV